MEQEIILQNHTARTPQMREVNFPQVNPVQLQVAGVRSNNPLKQSGDGGLPGTTLPNQFKHVPRRYLTIHTIQSFGSRTRIDEIHPKRQSPFDLRSHTGC